MAGIGTGAGSSVLMVLDSAFPPGAGGGSEGQVLTLGRQLVAQGIRVVVVTPRADRGTPTAERVEGIEVVRLTYPKVPKVGGMVVLARLALWLLAHGRRHSAIHAHIAGGMAAVACIVGRVIRRPVVVKLAGGWELDTGIFAAGRRGPATALTWWALRRATFYQATSERLAGHLVARGFDGGRVRNVPNAVDLARFRPALMDGRDGPSVDADLVAVFVGRLVREKALELCLEAWAAAFPADASVALLVVGSGELEEVLRATAARLGIGHQVRFVGHQRDVRPFLGVADFALLPSTSEGLSNALLEYMAAGLPVLGSRISGTEDMIVPGETGWLFESGDTGALRQRLREVRALPREARRAMGLRARERVERRAGAAAVTERLKELYGLGGAPTS
jgi:glycosyltransferase involved in cell wall biosynthesis